MLKPAPAAVPGIDLLAPLGSWSGGALVERAIDTLVDSMFGV